MLALRESIKLKQKVLKVLKWLPFRETSYDEFHLKRKRQQQKQRERGHAHLVVLELLFLKFSESFQLKIRGEALDLVKLQAEIWKTMTS